MNALFNTATEILRQIKFDCKCGMGLRNDNGKQFISSLQVSSNLSGGVLVV